MRVAVVGSRDIPDYVDVDYVIQYIPLNCTEIVSGGALGIDTLAREAAKKLDLPIKEFFPDYRRYGKRAPLVRNDQIVEYADYVIAIWNEHSTGTAYTVNQCIKRYVPFRVYPIKPPLDSRPKIML